MVGQSWHECSGYDYSRFGFNTFVNGCSLDIQPLSGGADDVFAPITGTIERACTDGTQGFIKIGKMSILHLQHNSNLLYGVNVKKYAKIGQVYAPSFTSSTNCGRTTGAHLHIKILDDNMTIDGTTLRYNSDYKLQYLTSQNTPPSAATGFLKSLSDNNRLFDIYGGAANNQDKVVLWGYNGGYNNQRWTYNSGNQSFTTAVNNRCLDTGNVGDPNNRWLRMSDCSGNDNQKWVRGSDKTLRVKANLGLCLDSQSGNANGSTLYLNNCNGSNNQKFGMDDFTSMGFVEQNITTPVATTPKFTFRLQGTNYCMDAYNPYNGRAVYTWNCNGSQAQKWDFVPTNRNNGSLLRSTNTNYCVDLYQASNGRSTYTWQCDPNANNHNWYYDQTSKTLRQMGTNQCLDAYNPFNGRAVYTWDCNNSWSQKWDNLYQGTW